MGSNEAMSSEQERLKTFTLWTFTNPCAEEMASQGFVQVHPDIAKCTFCGVELRCVSEEDLAFECHLDKIHSIGSDCSFLRDYHHLKSPDTWCDWSSVIDISVPCHAMDVVWKLVRALRDASKEGKRLGKEERGEVYTKEMDKIAKRYRKIGLEDELSRLEERVESIKEELKDMC